MIQSMNWNQPNYYKSVVLKTKHNMNKSDVLTFKIEITVHAVFYDDDNKHVK